MVKEIKDMHNNYSIYIHTHIPNQCGAWIWYSGSEQTPRSNQCRMKNPERSPPQIPYPPIFLWTSQSTNEYAWSCAHILYISIYIAICGLEMGWMIKMWIVEVCRVNKKKKKNRWLARVWIWWRTTVHNVFLSSTFCGIDSALHGFSTFTIIFIDLLL